MNNDPNKMMNMIDHVISFTTKLYERITELKQHNQLLLETLRQRIDYPDFENFEVGRYVVYIGDVYGEWPEGTTELPLKVGVKYTISWKSDDHGIIDLEEVPSPETDTHYRGYCMENFITI